LIKTDNPDKPKGEFIRKLGGWGKYYEYLANPNSPKLPKMREPIKAEKKIGRNSLVTIKKGDAVKVLKYKKAQQYLSQDWILDE